MSKKIKVKRLKEKVCKNLYFEFLIFKKTVILVL